MNRAWIGLMLLGAACRADAFTCVDDEQCVAPGKAGVCQPDGYCSFEDEECSSGQRYGALGNDDRSGQCVAPGAQTDAATSTTSATTDASTTGASDSSGGTDSASTASSVTDGADETTTGGGSGGVSGDGESTGGSSPVDCMALCDTKDACGFDVSTCLFDCQSVATIAEQEGTEPCVATLSQAVDCHAELDCNELEEATVDIWESTCANANGATGQACFDVACATYCDKVEQCDSASDFVPFPRGGGAFECEIACSAHAVLDPLHQGGVACLEARRTLGDCLNALECPHFLEANEGLGGDCESEWDDLYAACFR